MENVSIVIVMDIIVLNLASIVNRVIEVYFTKDITALIPFPHI